MEMDDDNRNRKGVFARFAELIVSAVSLRVIVALAASSTVTGAVAGPLAAKAFQARAEAEQQQVTSTTLPASSSTASSSPSSTAAPSSSPTQPSQQPSSTPSTTATTSTTTTAPPATPSTSSTTTTFGQPAVTFDPNFTTTTTTSTTTTAPPTTAAPTTAAPTTAAPTTTAVPYHDGLTVASEQWPDRFDLLADSTVWGRVRIFFVGPPGTTAVNFWLDSAPPSGPTSSDQSAPFDFAQTADGSGFFDTSQLANGSHTIRTVATVNGVQVEEAVSFTVGN